MTSHECPHPERCAEEAAWMHRPIKWMEWRQHIVNGRQAPGYTWPPEEDKQFFDSLISSTKVKPVAIQERPRGNILERLERWLYERL